jgi:hypothetical protein
MKRIPDLESYRYNVEGAARKISRHCITQLRHDTRPNREANAHFTLHTAVLEEMLAFKEQLDAAIADTFQFGLDKLKEPTP